ncbi:MAG: hypothetical protein FWE06_03330 [Oscillospiraceae bacterium]|nr:hypothetical protein [Oscillospiraceae bacterium]
MQNSPAPHATITKRIRTTKYHVNVYYGTASKESINDSILRLIENDLATKSKTH